MARALRVVSQLDGLSLSEAEDALADARLVLGVVLIVRPAQIKVSDGNEVDSEPRPDSQQSDRLPRRGIPTMTSGLG
jgi:hypothetical protein